MSQSTQEYDPSKYTKNRGIFGPLPSNYICHRCGQRGHYIKQCPTNNVSICHLNQNVKNSLMTTNNL
jgi:hypothetical protein